jgi:hypothetical protein
MHGDGRIEHLQRITHLGLAGPLDVLLGIRATW